jgi:cysteinyl-tRNA synthetase
MLMTHYREPIDFSVKRLEEASNVLGTLRRWAFGNDENFDADYDPSSPCAQVIEALTDDLNTPAAIQALQRLVGDLWDREMQIEPAHHRRLAELRQSMRLLGFKVEADKEAKAVAEAAIPKRLAFIREKNWAEADRIRDELLEQGIQLKDSKDPETGERVTTWEVRR